MAGGVVPAMSSVGHFSVVVVVVPDVGIDPVRVVCANCAVPVPEN